MPAPSAAGPSQGGARATWRRRLRPRLPAVRTVLLVGFGTILVLWGIAGASFARRIRDGDMQAAATNARYERSREILDTVQTQIVLGSVYLRDALLDTDATRTDAYARQMRDAYTTAERALADYHPVADSPAIQQQVESLRRHLRGLRSTRLAIFSSRAHVPQGTTADLLRRNASPQRQVLLDASRQIETLDYNAYTEQKAQVAAIAVITERQIWRSLAAALVATLLVAVLATGYVGRLERRVRAQHEREMSTAQDLHELSAQLVTAQEDERRLIARELHDEAGQLLTALKMGLMRAKKAGGPAAQGLEELRGLAGQALEAVRNVSQLLHPPHLDDLGLAAALEMHVRRFGAANGLNVEFEADGLGERLAPETEIAAYRIVQEALTNVARHAGGTTCNIRLARSGDRLVVTIDDNGHGIDPASDPASGGPSGLGLLGIRERVAQMQGTLRLESAVGRGTRLTFEVPLRAARAHDAAGGLPLPPFPADGEMSHG